MGRPSKFTQALADEICARLLKPESLRQICESDGMPGLTTIMVWLNEKQDFRDQYARARELQADIIGDETFQIVDDGKNDWMDDGEGAFQLNHEHISRSRLRFDQRRWWLSKLAPKKYGDKIEHEVSANHKVHVIIGGDQEKSG